MVTPQAQIKINLPLALKEFLESKANKFGMPIAGYVRHLILRDIEDMEYPAYEMSERAEKAYRRAKKDEKAGKLIKVDNLKKFFADL